VCLFQGDSGGPFVVDNKLVGIATMSFPCYAFLGVYTKISSVYQWIDNIISEKSNSSQARAQIGL
jgi:secreted trypsin-like serine protease